MKVRIKILWKLQVKNVEVDGSKQCVAKNKITSVTLKELRKDGVTFLASFRKRGEFRAVWFVSHHDLIPDHERTFVISAYVRRNHIITTL